MSSSTRCAWIVVARRRRLAELQTRSSDVDQPIEQQGALAEQRQELVERLRSGVLLAQFGDHLDPGRDGLRDGGAQSLVGGVDPPRTLEDRRDLGRDAGLDLGPAAALRQADDQAQDRVRQQVRLLDIRE